MKNQDLDKLMQSVFSWMGKKPASDNQSEGIKKACLSEETITDYLASRLPKQERKIAEAHFFECHTCRRLLTTLAKVENMETELDSRETTVPGLTIALDSMKDVFKISLSWIKGCLIVKETNADSFPDINMNLLPVRGDDHPPSIESYFFVKTVGGFKITAQVKKEVEKRCRLCFEITSLRGDKGLSKIRADILEGGRIIQSRPVKDGKVVLHDLRAGSYEMIIREGGHPLVRLWLNIEDNNNDIE